MQAPMKCSYETHYYNFTLIHGSSVYDIQTTTPSLDIENVVQSWKSYQLTVTVQNEAGLVVSAVKTFSELINKETLHNDFIHVCFNRSMLGFSFRLHTFHRYSAK